MKKRTAHAVETVVTRGKTPRRESSPGAEPQRGVVVKVVEGKQGLSEQVAALEAELAIYREALKNSRDDMQAFAYSVSHDLKAPLRAIEGFSKILLEDFSKELDPEAQRFLRHIVANTETLGAQIEDLLKYYRAGKNPPARMPVNMDAVCREILATLPPPDAGRVKIVENLPTVLGDAMQLREVFSQL